MKVMLLLHQNENLGDCFYPNAPFGSPGENWTRKFLREREVTITNLSTGPFMKLETMKLETSEGIEPTLNQFCRLTPMPVLGKMPKVRGKMIRAYVWDRTTGYHLTDDISNLRSNSHRYHRTNWNWSKLILNWLEKWDSNPRKWRCIRPLR